MTCEFYKDSEMCNQCVCANCEKLKDGGYCNTHWMYSSDECDKGYANALLECDVIEKRSE